MEEGTYSKLGLAAVVAAVLVLSVSCASVPPGKDPHSLALDSWVGSDINRTIVQWGPPSDVYTHPNGDQTYTWMRVAGTLVTKTHYQEFLGPGGTQSTSVQVYCKDMLVVHPDGKIWTWRWEGNNCK